MLNELPTPARRDRGFTLVELLVVVAIIGILAGIAIPVFLNQQKSARDAGVEADVQNSSVSVARWVLDNSRKAVTNTTDYSQAGGQLVQTDGNVIDITTSGTGTYTVCGYTAEGSKYTSSTSAYLYTSTTGTGSGSSAGCPGDGVAGTTTGTTGGSAGGGTTTGGTTTGGSTGGGTTTGGSTGGGTTSTPTATPTATSEPDWTYCAGENGTCQFQGTHVVRYGSAPTWAETKTFTGGTGCNNSVFGDPLVGTVKACYYLP